MAKQIDMHLDNVPYVIAACCVLHNVCEVHHDSFNEEWLQEIDLSQPDCVASTSTQLSQTGGEHVQAILMNYFFSPKLLHLC